MFDIFKRKDKNELIAPVSGDIFIIDKKILKDHDIGYIINAVDFEILAPIDGTIEYISDPKNKYRIKNDDLIVTIQVGEIIDEAKISDGIFKANCHIGNHIQKGDILASVDMMRYADLEARYVVYVFIDDIANKKLDIKKYSGKVNEKTPLIKW